MPLLEQEKAIKEYYEEVKDKYPNVDFSSFRQACRFPFEYVKKVISSGNLAIIKVKYLGKFRTFPAKVKDRIRANKLFYERSIIDQETFESENTRLTTHLNDLNDYYSRNQEDTEEGSQDC